MSDRHIRGSGIRRARAAGALVLAALLAPAELTGQTLESPSMPMSRTLPETTLRAIARDPDRFLSALLRRMRKLSPDRLVTEADAQRAAQARKAMRRAVYLETFLSRDLDGDGTVTRAEFMDSLGQADRSGPDPYDTHLRTTDANSDGALSVDEIYARADAVAEAQQRRRFTGANALDPAQFDANGDGLVSEEEATKTVRTIAGELALLNHFAAAAPAGLRCDAPRPGAGDEVVLLSGARGDGLSTVATDGMEMDTTVATVIVEEGATPLYLFATTGGRIIWKLSGAVERVSHFVVQVPPATLGPGAGVVGLPPEVVDFEPPGACIEPFSKPKAAQAARAVAQLAEVLGRSSADITVIAGRDIFSVRVPSGKRRVVKGSFLGISITEPEKPDPPPEGGRVVRKPPTAGSAALGENLSFTRDDTWPPEPALKEGAIELQERRKADEIMQLRTALERIHPSGVIEIDPDEVIAPGIVQPYDVRPMHAGIIQLLETGAIQKTSRDTYVVVKPIPRLPTGWGRRHDLRRRVILGKDIPEPGLAPGPGAGEGEN